MHLGIFYRQHMHDMTSGKFRPPTAGNVSDCSRSAGQLAIQYSGKFRGCGEFRAIHPESR